MAQFALSGRWNVQGYTQTLLPVLQLTYPFKQNGTFSSSTFVLYSCKIELKSYTKQDVINLMF